MEKCDTKNCSYNKNGECKAPINYYKWYTGKHECNSNNK